MVAMGARERGSGSYYLKGNIYYISYWVNGRQVKKTTKSRDEEEAKRQLRIAIGEAATGRDVTPERATIDDLFGLVLADQKLRKLRDAATVEWRYNANLKPLVGSLLASRFTPHQARELIAQRRKQGAGDATINRELSIIRRGFNLALREDPPLVRRAPYIPKLEEDNTRQGFIEHEQYLALRAVLPDHLKTLLVVAYHCGNRLGELRKLRWRQVDLEAGEIRIERRQAKGKKARTLPIYGDMREWLEWQAKHKAPGCDLVFHWNGKPIGSHVKGWKRGCKDAGLEDLSRHDLRRSAIRNMERAGIPRHVAMGFSGHKTESTYRRYDIVVNEDLKSATQKLEQYQKLRAPKLRRVK
jgi:integrase